MTLEETTVSELEEHGEQMADLTLVMIIDNYIETGKAIAALLEDQEVIDLDSIDALKAADKALRRFRQRYL